MSEDDRPVWIPGEPARRNPMPPPDDPWRFTLVMVVGLFLLGVVCIIGAFRPETDLWVQVGLFLVVALCAGSSLYLVAAKIRTDREEQR